MLKIEYIELLKNPLWINKRKRIIIRDGKKCTVCNVRKKLQVHHTYYYNQPVEPWRYPDDSLITLCEGCHKDYHEHHENEYRDKPKTIIKKKFKPRRICVRKNKKSPNKNKRKNPLSLAEEQMLRLGYRRDGVGFWIK